LVTGGRTEVGYQRLYTETRRLQTEKRVELKILPKDSDEFLADYVDF